MTSTPTSWLSEVADAISVARDADQAEKQTQSLDDARLTLDDFLASFSQLRDSAQVARTIGWTGRGAPPDVFQNLKAAATFDPRPLTKLSQVLEAYRADLRASLVASWKQHGWDRLGDVEDLRSLARNLSAVADVAELSQLLDIALGALAQTQSDPPNSEAVARLDEAEKRLAALERSLRPDSVRKFLSATARAGASIDSLDADVLAWISEHGAMGSFRIVPGRPSDGHDD